MLGRLNSNPPSILSFALALVALALALAGCGGGTPSGTTTPNPPDGAGVSHWPAPVTTNTEPWNVSPFFWYGNARIVGNDASGASLILAGESRARVTPNAVEWALQATGLQFEDAQEMGGTWYFWDESGAVLSAAGGFLGELTEVGRAPVRLDSTLVSDGVLLARLADHSIATFDPTHGVRVLSGPVAGPMIDAAFLSPTSGVVIAPPGRLYRTTDGDAFTAVDTGTSILIEVWPMEGAFWVRTSTGFLRVGDDGVAAPFEGDPPWPAEIPDDVAAQLEEALETREPFDFGPMPGPAGRVVLDWTDGTVDVWDAAEGLRMIQPPGAHCSLAGLGDRVLAACENEDASFDIHLSEDMSHFRQLGTVRLRYGVTDDVFLSPDGSSIVVQGRCGDPDAAGYETLCWHDGASFRERTVPPNSTVISVLREWALVTSVVAETGTNWVGLLDLRGTGEATPLVAPAGVTALEHAHFAADGSISAIAYTAETASLAIGRAGEPLTLLPLPEGCSEFEMADAAHGLAVGSGLAAVWATTDGGHTWGPLDVPFRGVPGEYESSAYDRVLCSASGCVLSGLFFWGPDRMIPESARQPGESLLFLAQSPEAAPDPTDGTHSHTWACTVPATVAPRLEGLLLGPGWANLDEHYDQSESGGYSIAVRWGGADDRGAFTLTSQRLPVRSGSEGTSLVAATRRFAVLARASYDAEDGSYIENLLIATPDGMPRLDPISSHDDDLQSTTYWGVAPALTLANGGVVILSTGASEMAPHVNLHTLLHLGPDGAEIARRLYVFPAEEHEIFPAATATGEVGLVSRARRGTALMFHPIAGGDSRAMGELHTPGGACGRETGRTRMLRTSTATTPLTVNATAVGYEPLVNVIEVATSGDACVSAVFPSPEASYDGVAASAFGVPMAWVNRGRVTAMSLSPETGSLALTCTITPPPAE